jgi:hypothetical protein
VAGHFHRPAAQMAARWYPGAQRIELAACLSKIEEQNGNELNFN